MAELLIDIDLLERFERGLDPTHLERSAIPAVVLGYGEISTVLAIGGGDLACKRMPMFADEAEIAAYSAAFDAYRAKLQEAGLRVAPGVLVPLQQRSGGRRVVYLVEQRLPGHAIGNAVVRRADPPAAQRLLQAVLGELAKVWRFNREQAGAAQPDGPRWQLGIDGQISNWVVENMAAQGELPATIDLCYFDVNTPLLRRNGVEQLDTELFLRSAPGFLRWVLRLFVLQDVVARYYDPRRVVIDLIANLYKEGRADLAPAWLETANRFFAEELAGAGLQRIDLNEVLAYYREDVRIWRLYLGLRRFDRTLHRGTGRQYSYVLPGPIQR
ncbi:MAG TPA: DUF6206 family protein [Anaerolineae bacterium]|nr:DUF6206 family protein [Anaerolineae bacterium]